MADSASSDVVEHARSLLLLRQRAATGLSPVASPPSLTSPLSPSGHSDSESEAPLAQPDVALPLPLAFHLGDAPGGSAPPGLDLEPALTTGGGSPVLLGMAASPPTSIAPHSPLAPPDAGRAPDTSATSAAVTLGTLSTASAAAPECSAALPPSSASSFSYAPTPRPPAPASGDKRARPRRGGGAQKRAASGSAGRGGAQKRRRSPHRMAPGSELSVRNARLRGDAVDHFWRRAGYSPFFGCEEHAVCRERSALGMDALLKGQYVSEVRKGTIEVTQAKDGFEVPYAREEEVGDDHNGRCNLAHLHLIRAHAIADRDRRPLLFPAIEQKYVRTGSPIKRMLANNKLFCGRFFNPDGSAQRQRCILIAFPKNHRGSVRLQLKVFNIQTQNISNNADKDDCKAHFLSYVSWLFGITHQTHEELGQWPITSCTCTYGRRGRNNFGNQEFLCINPYHYVERAPGELDNEPQAARLEGHIRSFFDVCVKGYPSLPGERPNPSTGKSFCFCMKCRGGAVFPEDQPHGPAVGIASSAPAPAAVPAPAPAAAAAAAVAAVSSAMSAAVAPLVVPQPHSKAGLGGLLTPAGVAVSSPVLGAPMLGVSPALGLASYSTGLS